MPRPNRLRLKDQEQNEYPILIPSIAVRGYFDPDTGDVEYDLNVKVRPYRLVDGELVEHPQELCQALGKVRGRHGTDSAVSRLVDDIEEAIDRFTGAKASKMRERRQ